MRSKQERRMRHISNLRTARSSSTTAPNRELITKSKGKVYKQTKVGGQSFYVEIKTKKD